VIKIKIKNKAGTGSQHSSTKLLHLRAFASLRFNLWPSTRQRAAFAQFVSIRGLTSACPAGPTNAAPNCTRRVCPQR